VVGLGGSVGCAHPHAPLPEFHFDASQYDAEVARAESDRGTPKKFADLRKHCP
jgi:hypothetical protein